MRTAVVPSQVRHQPANSASQYNITHRVSWELLSFHLKCSISLQTVQVHTVFKLKNLYLMKKKWNWWNYNIFAFVCTFDGFLNFVLFFVESLPNLANHATTAHPISQRNLVSVINKSISTAGAIYKWKQICKNSLVIICPLDKKEQHRRWHTEKCSVPQFSNFS